MEVPVLIPIGDDITAGSKARLCDVSDADLARWYGIAPASLTAWPLVAPMPGVRSWLHKLPHANVEERPIVAVGSNTIEISGSPLVDPTDVGTWVFIATNETGQGQYRRITALFDGGATLQLNAIWNPVPTDIGAGFGNLKIIRNSHRIAAGSTLLVISKHGETPEFDASDVGKTVVFFGAYDGNPAQLTREIVAQTSHTITLDYPLLGGADTLPVDSGFAVLSGPNSVEDLDVTNGAALVPFGLNLDDAPVYSTGQDRCYTGDMGTPCSSPLHELGLKLTVVSADSTHVTVDRSAFLETDVGNLIKVGTQTRRITVADAGSDTVTVDSAWSPIPGASERVILVRSTMNHVAQLAWRMRQRFAKPMVVLELGTAAARILPYAGVPGPTSSSWHRHITSTDFCPSSDAGLYRVLRDSMLSCKALVEAEGNTAKFYVLINCADHDAVVPNYLHIGSGMRVLRDALRVDLGDATMPFIIAGPSAYGQGPPDLRADIYTQLAAMKAEDAWTSYADTRTGLAKASDGLNLSAAGQVALADMLADTLNEVLDRAGALPDSANFVVEDGNGLPNATSLCSVEFADAYLQDYEDPPAWRTATLKKKRDALRRMSRWVTHRRRYIGERVHGDQTMAFPRFGLVDEDGFVIDHLSVPERVKQATAYGAWRIVEGDWDPFPDESVDGGLQAKSIAIGPIRIDKSYAGPRQSNTETKLTVVNDLLASFSVPMVTGRICRG